MNVKKNRHLSPTKTYSEVKFYKIIVKVIPYYKDSDTFYVQHRPTLKIFMRKVEFPLMRILVLLRPGRALLAGTVTCDV